jgi:ubiquinone/menaquinone biosynthesis C-methylase UbiE
MPMQRDPEGIEVRYLHAFADLRDARILEVGCGDGRATWRYAQHPRRITAIDPDPAYLDAALAARPEALRHSVTFIRSSAENLPFAAQTFDGAILTWSL